MPMEAAQAAPRSCSTCNGKMYLVERVKDRAQAKPCACAQACRRCGGAGYVYVTQQETFSQKVGAKTYEVLSPCACRVVSKRVQLFNEAGVPAVLAGKVDFDSYRNYSEGQERAKKVATAFAFGYRKGEPMKGFVLAGPVGTGKTHLLGSVLTHLTLEVGAPAKYVEISLLFATIRRGFQEGKSGGEIIGPLSEVEVLAIDELGKGRGSPFELETLDELIARRYNAGRTTLFATNYSLAWERPSVVRADKHLSSAELKGAGQGAEILRERVSERIYSRLSEMCEFVELPMSTPDCRRPLQETKRRI